MTTYANLVYEESTSTGTGNLTTTRVGGHQRGSDSTAFGTGDNGGANPYIFVVNKDASAAEWEICQAYWSAAGTLVRGTVLLSSNSNAAVNFGAGTKTITNDIPSAFQVTTTGTQTLTGKSINAAANTISNLATSMFAANVIDTDATLAAASATRIATQSAVKSYVDNAVTGGGGNGVSVADHGAAGDGTTDDTSAILTAIGALSGPGNVFFPPGNYLVSETGVSSVAIAIAASGVRLIGAGSGASKITLDDAQDSHVISIASVNDVEIIGLEIDGNRANQTTAGHGIRIADASRTRIHDCHIHDCHSYGIGAQGGTVSHSIVDGCVINNTGADGIDWKNKDDDNDTNIISNTVVSNFGLDGARSVQVGIDVRGPMHISGVTISGFPTDGMGIRMRQGELLDTNGFGAHQSTLSQFRVIGSGGTQVGVYVAARDTQISDGYIEGVNRGIDALEPINARGITCVDCTDDGVSLRTSGALDAIGSKLHAVVVEDATDDGINVEVDDVSLVDCRATGCDVGVRRASGVRGLKLIGGDYSGNDNGPYAIADGVQPFAIGTTYDPLADLYMERMEIAPSPALVRALNDFAVALRASAGLIDELLCLYLAVHTEQASDLNVMSENFTLTAFGSPGFTPYTSRNGDGVDDYFDSGFTPSSDGGSVLTQDDTHIGAWVTNNVQSSSDVVSAAGAHSFRLQVRDTSNRVWSRTNNNTTETTAGSTDGRGHSVANRTGASAITHHKNAALIGSPNQASSGLAPNTVKLLRTDTAGVYTPNNVFAAHWGGSLTSGQLTALYNALNALRNTLLEIAAA